MDPLSLCGALVVGGFDGTSLPAGFARALAGGERGGAILFKRNLDGDPAQAAALCRAVHTASAGAALTAVDQEGGRVARLGPPLLQVPPMRTVASWGDEAFAERIARAVGAELRSIGFDVDFAPVLDVNTRADNPVIGDRAFGDEPDVCARFGAAWVRGLQGAGVVACGKHFPGHGGGSKDSHHELPTIDRTPLEIERVDLAPFRAAVAAGVASVMTAHVVFPSLDAALPATLSPRVCTTLRAAIGFEGVLFSDDLEMRAIADRWPVADAAVLAVAAGCDAVLVCKSEELQQLAFEALVREAGRSTTFRARCEQAGARLAAARALRRSPATERGDTGSIIGGDESRSVAAEMARRSRP